MFPTVMFIELPFTTHVDGYGVRLDLFRQQPSWSPARILDGQFLFFILD